MVQKQVLEKSLTKKIRQPAKMNVLVNNWGMSHKCSIPFFHNFFTQFCVYILHQCKKGETFECSIGTSRSNNFRVSVVWMCPILLLYIECCLLLRRRKKKKLHQCIKKRCPIYPSKVPFYGKSQFEATKWCIVVQSYCLLLQRQKI